MVMLEFSEGFIKKCEDFIKNNPEAAKDVSEFLERCGRLGVYMLTKIYGDCGESNDTSNNDGDNMGTTSKDKTKTVKIYINDEEFEKVRRFVEKHNLFRTTISLYYFSALMVMLGYWELPPKI